MDTLRRDVHATSRSRAMSHRVDRGVPAMECGLGGRVPVPVSGSVFGHRDFAIL